MASTKAFTAPLVDQYMLAILLADLRGTLDEEHAPSPGRRPATHARPGRADAGARSRGQKSWHSS